MKEVADKFYGTKVDMKMEKQEVVFDTVVTSFHMKFENKVFIAAKEAEAKVKESSMPVRAAILFEMFPFCILFTVSWLCKESSMPVRAISELHCVLLYKFDFFLKYRKSLKLAV